MAQFNVCQVMLVSLVYQRTNAFVHIQMILISGAACSASEQPVPPDMQVLVIHYPNGLQGSQLVWRREFTSRFLQGRVLKKALPQDTCLAFHIVYNAIP